MAQLPPELQLHRRRVLKGEPMRHKTFELLEVKADGGEGQFTALASVFGNVDLVGDRMLPGAFSKTLDDWRESGDPIPVVLSHQWDDPMAYVGKADPAQVVETDQGLQVNGTLDTSNPVGKQVYSLMKQRLIKGWSFGYTVPEGGEKVNDGVNEVSQVELIEVGPTLKGANPEAQLQAIKAMKQLDADLDAAEDDEAEEPDEELSQDEPAVEETDDETPNERKSRAQDALRRRGEALAFSVDAANVDLRAEPPDVKEPETPEFSTRELRRRTSDQIVRLLAEGEE